jgi:hypothetical protein
MKPPHYRGSYHIQARQVRVKAYLDPTTRCWRCNLTLSEIHKHKPNAKWTAGHLTDGQAGGPLAPECSPCNYSHGARHGNQKRKPRLNTSRQW